MFTKHLQAQPLFYHMSLLGRIARPTTRMGCTTQRPLAKPMSRAFHVSPRIKLAAVYTAAGVAQVGAVGGSALWGFANLSYAGMRAQNDPNNNGWRTGAFIFGLPGTLVSLACVDEGSERVYGVDIPRKTK